MHLRVRPTCSHQPMQPANHIALIEITKRLIGILTSCLRCTSFFGLLLQGTISKHHLMIAFTVDRGHETDRFFWAATTVLFSNGKSKMRCNSHLGPTACHLFLQNFTPESEQDVFVLSPKA